MPKITAKNSSVTATTSAKGPSLPSIPKTSARPARTGGLFDNEDDEDSFAPKKAKPAAFKADEKKKKGLFDDEDDDDDGFLKKPAAKPKMTLPQSEAPSSRKAVPTQKKNLFDEEDDDDGFLSRKPNKPFQASTIKGPEPALSKQKGLFDEGEVEEVKASKPGLGAQKNRGLFDDDGSDSEDLEAERKRREAKRKITQFK